MDNRKSRLIFLAIIFMLFITHAFADYKSDISQGNAAYKSGDYQKALTFYMSADIENPGPQLESLISAIEKKLDQAKNPELSKSPDQANMPAPPAAAVFSPAVQKPENTGFGTALLCVDAVALATALYSYIDYNGAADYYGTMYSLYNGTTGDNAAMLTALKKYTEQKGGAAAITGVVTGALIAYTLSDIFFIHSAFPVQAAFDPGNGKVSLAYSVNY